MSTTFQSSASPAGNPSPDHEYILTFSCPQRPGLVHSLTGGLTKFGGNIIELKQFDDPRADHFYFRVHFSLAEANDSASSFAVAIRELAESLGAVWSITPHRSRQRVLIMVSKHGHCLNDLLYRARVGELSIDIGAVVSNHPDHRELVEWHRIPYFHIPITAETKPEAEAKLLNLVDRFDIDLIVLARYMQILSEELTKKFAGRAINIHHSFLPSFKGAHPYRQAYERGVKTVGATAHYINDLCPSR